MSKIDIVAGIDIGGTNTKLGLVDREGNIVVDTFIPTNGQDPAARLIARVADKIGELLKPLEDKYRIVGIGVGAPNANYHRGTVEYPPNLNWPGVTNVVASFRQFYDVPVVITNDANAAALGEGHFGAAKGMKDYVVITLGTGLGSGIVSNGSLVYGHDGFAGEVGHTIYDPNGRLCGCGNKGCLEQYASAPGIVKTVFELLSQRRDESELRNIPYNDMTAKQISDAANRGDAIALEAFNVTSRILGMKLADTVAHTSPEAIILFGGLANAGRLIIEPTKRYLEQYLLNIFRNKVKVIPSGLKEANAAVLGASALIWNELAKSSLH